MAEKLGYTQEQVLGILRSMEGFRVIDQKPCPPLTEIDLGAFVSGYPGKTPDVQHAITRLADACRKFLSGIVLTDCFDDHAKRRDWRFAMYDKYGSAFWELSARNKLRRNMLAIIYMILETAGKQLEVFRVGGEKATTIRALAGQLPSLDNYDGCPVEEKLEIVSRFDELCIAFLAAVAK